MTRPLISRRRFLTMALAAAPGLSMAGVAAMEPEWLRVSSVSLGDAGGKARLVHISDLHYQGDDRYAERVAGVIRKIAPDFVCFTGDLIEHADHLDGALAFVASMGCPVFGVPGNHDVASGVSPDRFQRGFASTGGAWLVDQSVVGPGGIEVVGMGTIRRPPLSGRTERDRILLTHYPVMADMTDGERFSLVLAGHSHGGQIRLPFVGATYLPSGVGRYDLGLYRTPAGPLYVNAGLGTSTIPVRFNCRPEVTVCDLHLSGKV